MTICAALGHIAHLPQGEATVVTVGSVLMPAMEIQGGSLGNGPPWLLVLAELHALALLCPWVVDVETLATWYVAPTLTRSAG